MPGAGPRKNRERGQRARLNEHEFRRTAEVLPHLNKLPGKQTAKDGMHVDACVVVRETLGFCLAVIPFDRMVEALAHIVREGEGAEAANAVGKQFSEWRHAPMAPAESPAGSAWIFLQARSKTPCAASSKSTKKTVSSEVSPLRCRAASRSMISAQSFNGNPAIPVPTAGNAMVFSPRSLAILKEWDAECRSESALVFPPSCMLAA